MARDFETDPQFQQKLGRRPQAIAEHEASA